VLDDSRPRYHAIVRTTAIQWCALGADMQARTLCWRPARLQTDCLAMASERNVQFSAPTWIRDLGFSSWLLVGFVLVIVGLIWLLGQTSTIVMPVILATVLGAVAGPAVGWLERHRVPRAGGAILVLVGLVAIGVLIFCLVFGGISAQSGDISAKLNKSLNKIQGWLSDVGVDNAQSAKEGVQEAAPDIRTTLLGGVAAGVEGLKSLLFFLAFATLSTLFVLKDGPVMHRFINRHMGVPEPVANVVTTNIAKSLRSYFLAVTIIAGFNAILIGGAALILGVPLAGTIAVVTFVGAYVPFVGAWVAGGFAVLIALSTGSTSDALILAVVALLANGVLQQMIQPFVMGATLSLNPLVVLVVTIGAGALFGMVGLTLAAPLTSAAVHIGIELRNRGPDPATVEAAPAPSG
jgi:predicted PurR-regulated permease PerM